MPRVTAQRTHLRNLQASRLGRATISEEEIPLRTPKTRRQKNNTALNTRIDEQDAYIKILESEIEELRSVNADNITQIQLHTSEIDRLQLTAKESHAQLEDTLSQNSELSRSLASTRIDLKKQQKRSQRLLREKTASRTDLKNQLAASTATHDKISGNYLASLNLVDNLRASVKALESSLEKVQAENSEFRKKVHRLDMQRRRAQESLANTRLSLQRRRVWSPTKRGVYTAEARRLARALLKAGCSGERVGDAMVACGKAFGVRVTRKISRTTVERARDEGGYFGLIQLGREIQQGLGFGESSDGTTDRKVTYEARHITQLAPTYEEGVDDSDMSTWKHQTRFAEVAPAVDHTAKTQFEGTKELAGKIASAYSDSPVSARDGKKMELDDWIRKEEYQSMDHAADGKKKLKLCEDWKKEVAIQDLGAKVVDEMDTEELLRATLSIPQEEVVAAFGDSPSRQSALSLLEKKLGSAVLTALPEAKQNLLVTLLFAGCCGHKDLNAFKYGVMKMQRTWEEKKRPPPVLLANKANAATIQLGQNVESAAVQRAIDSSTHGGVKLVSLAGALFNNKIDGKGYQDIHRMFMSKHKLELHGIKSNERYPDANNTRYQSHSYGSAELIVFLDLYIALLEEVRDSKQKPGFNHMEKNVAKGLECASTLAEVAAMALYGLCISWPYLGLVRGKSSEERPNLLDPAMVDLHRKLPAFCDHIAENPRLLFDEDVDFKTLTIDGKPSLNTMIVAAIQVLSAELPDLDLMIWAMFSGCADGWRQFTAEFEPGGPFDSLTPEQRERMFIPATNDPNEGALGSWRVHVRYHPNSASASFSNKTRLERNNTEMFIEKVCNTDEDLLYVMRKVRLQQTVGEAKKFREHLLDAQRNRAAATRKKQDDIEKKKQAEIARLITVGLVVKLSIIERMTAAQLLDQIKIHKMFFNDEVLLKLRLKDLNLKVYKMTAVIAAVTRSEEKINALYTLMQTLNQQPEPDPAPDGSEPVGIFDEATVGEEDDSDDEDFY